MSKMILLEGERIDNTGFGDIRIIQKPEDFCYGVDAVILADFGSKFINGSKARFKSAVDLGTGTGIIPLILSHKTSLEKIYAIEVQKGSFDRAKRNVEGNSLGGKIFPLQLDILGAAEALGKGTTDTVFSNPPYMTNNGGLKNSNIAKELARHESTATLEDFIRIAAELLRDKGEFYMVHRPSRLVGIFSFGRKYRLEPKTVKFVLPNRWAEPNIVLVRFVKNGNAELKIEEPLCVYDEDKKKYSCEIMKIYERAD